MKRLNRDMEAVSPVIATILMVAITVVLAATLYMMVGDIGGDDVQTLTGDITYRDDAGFEVVSISPNAEYGDVTVTLIAETSFDVDGNEVEEWSIGPGDDTNASWNGEWSFLSDDDEVQGGSRFDLNAAEDFGDDASNYPDFAAEDFDENIDEVVLQVDGVDGTISYEM